MTITSKMTSAPDEDAISLGILKKLSAQVVCLIYLLTLLSIVRINANSVDLDRYAPRSSLIRVHTVCRGSF